MDTPMPHTHTAPTVAYDGDTIIVNARAFGAIVIARDMTITPAQWRTVMGTMVRTYNDPTVQHIDVVVIRPMAHYDTLDGAWDHTVVVVDITYDGARADDGDTSVMGDAVAHAYIGDACTHIDAGGTIIGHHVDITIVG